MLPLWGGRWGRLCLPTPPTPKRQQAAALQKGGCRRGVRLDGEFRTVVPVSVRGADERDVPGNRVSVWLTTLPVDEPDARRRLAAVRAMTAQLKDNKEAMGAEVITQAAEWTTANVINLATQFINSARRFNLIVTNVPGPPIPFYLLGARMVAAYPHLPLFENQGLGVALFSYAGTLYWGVGGDWNQMPDLNEFIGDIAESFDVLCAAAREAALPTMARPSVPTPRRPRQPRLTARGAAAATPSAAPAPARGTDARTRAARTADGLRRAAPGPRIGTGRSSRSTAHPGAPR